MRARLALVAVALMASACAPGDIEFALEEYGGDGDLLTNDDPVVRASSRSAEEIPAIREAEEHLDRVFADFGSDEPVDDPGRLTALELARGSRPTDPRYDFYEAVWAGIAQSKTDDPADNARWADLSSDALFRATDKIATEHFTLSANEAARISHEQYMDTMRDVLDRLHESQPAGYGDAERRSLRGRYCAWIQVLYPEYHSEEFPSEVAFYLATSADRSVCED